jgi:predicted  nucleic acid-binding Zn-ribbon protein
MSSTIISDISVEEKLKSLYRLQLIDTKIDKIRIIRGELPLEVQDLEDELAGIQTRINKLQDEISELDNSIIDKKNAIKDSQTLIKKYEEQQSNVRNNREYESLNKEIEYQSLDIQLSEKRIKEFKSQIEIKTAEVASNAKLLEDRGQDLAAKKAELDDIVSETEKEESQLMSMSEEAAGNIEERLLIAYKKIRQNAINGLSVVSINRDSCGGCFNKIPPQRQMDIRLRKKVIVCEYCGRILVDQELAEENKID